MSLIERLQASEVVERVLYPALPTDPGYPIWQRDFTGASAVFSVIFKSGTANHVPPSLDVLETFAIGASWGGTRSLVAPMPVKGHRSATEWAGDDLILRISVGLEDPQDLIDDIDAVLADITSRVRVDR
jgi:cystathionine beta-lyase